MSILARLKMYNSSCGLTSGRGNINAESNFCRIIHVYDLKLIKDMDPGITRMLYWLGLKGLEITNGVELAIF